MPVFIFDLDGTLTQTETLPRIARHYAVAGDMAELTRRTVQGEAPFAESFTERVKILGRFPVEDVADLLEQTPLFPDVVSFIQANSDCCAIATANLSCWVHKLAARIGCVCHASDATVVTGTVAHINTILAKEDIVARYKRSGQTVVFIGDGDNDLEAMRQADISIACGLAHPPAPSILAIADHAVFDEAALCRLLTRLRDS